MSVGLTILLALVAWALGPLILRCAGGLMTTVALLLWAIPMGTHTSTIALIFTGVSGAAMWHTGTTWHARRHTARLGSRGGPPAGEQIGRGIALLRQRRNPRAEHQPAVEPYTSNHRDPGNMPHRKMWDEDVIDGVAYDIEPRDQW
jgi:hypothetical protein